MYNNDNVTTVVSVGKSARATVTEKKKIPIFFLQNLLHYHKLFLHFTEKTSNLRIVFMFQEETSTNPMECNSLMAKFYS